MWFEWTFLFRKYYLRKQGDGQKTVDTKKQREPLLLVVWCGAVASGVARSHLVALGDFFEIGLSSLAHRYVSCLVEIFGHFANFNKFFCLKSCKKFVLSERYFGLSTLLPGRSWCPRQTSSAVLPQVILAS